MTTEIKEQKEFVIYQTNDGSPKIEVRLENETIWLTNLQLTELFQTTKSNVSEHIKHIFEEGELSEISVVRNFRTTAADGKNYDTKHYNLDMIISLGYRINSRVAPPDVYGRLYAPIGQYFKFHRRTSVTKFRQNLPRTGDGKSKSRIPEVSAKNAVGRGNGIFGNDKNN